MVPGITHICTKLHGIVFKNIYIRNSRTDRCILLCSIDAHEAQQSYSVGEVISGGGNVLPSNLTT